MWSGATTRGSRGAAVPRQNAARRAAWRATVIYVVVAGLWILASSVMVEALVVTPGELARLEIAKGLLFVFVTGVLVFGLVRHGRGRAEAAEARYRALMEGMGSGVVIYRPLPQEEDFRILELNQAARRMGHLAAATSGPAAGRPVPVFQDLRQAGLLDALWRVVRSGTPEHLPEVRYADGPRDRWWDTYLYLLPDGDVVAVFDEVTERVEAEAALRRARAELEERVERRTAELAAANERLRELDRLKSLFIASMSHELRTPLNSIIGFSGVLLQGMAGPLEEKQRDYLRRVYGAGKHLLALITDVIDISKIEAGRIEVHVSRFSLEDVVAEALGTVEAAAAAKGLRVETRVVAGVTLEMDRRRLLQVLTNLLDNAVKYSTEGPVELDAVLQGDTLVVKVADRGIGIAQGDMPRLFQPFSRLEPAVAMRAPGTGLGLYLSRRIANDLLHGEIMAAGRPGGGAVFTLKVPRRLTS